MTTKPKTNKSMTEGVDYVYVEHDAADFYSIRLKSGPFSGVIYTYGRVSIKEERGQARLSFVFKIEDTIDCKFSKGDLESNADFKNYIGDVLADILSASEFQIGNNNGVQPANDNPEEPDPR